MSNTKIPPVGADLGDKNLAYDVTQGRLVDLSKDPLMLGAMTSARSQVYLPMTAQHAAALDRVADLERQRAETQALGGTAAHEEMLSQLDCDGLDARDNLNTCLSAGVDPSMDMLRLSTDTLGAMLRAREQFDHSSQELFDYQLARAHELRDAAREQARRFKRERDAARVELDRLRAVAEYGRAFMELVEQLDRLRCQPVEITGFEFGRESVVDAVRSELAEVLAESSGTEREQIEAGDVLGAALQLVLVLGESPLRAIVLVERRLRARLDLVEQRELTWEQAKAEIKQRENR